MYKLVDYPKAMLRYTVPAVCLTLMSLAFASDGLAAGRFEGVTVHLQAWGGREEAMIRKYITDPFQKETGANVVFETGWTSAAVAKLRAQKADPQLDLVMFDDIGVVTAGREGLLDTIDAGKVPNLKDVPDKYIFEKNQGVGFFVYLNSIAFSTKDFKEAPTSWQVLWDPKYKGRVILPTMDSISIYKLLIVASIMNGGSQTNMEPGFQAMERLKPNIHSFSKNEALIAEALRSDEASLASWQISIMKDYIAKGYPVGVTAQLKEGIFGTPGSVAIVKGHKAPTAALEDLVNRALSPEAQLGIAKDYWHSPTNRKVKVPDDLKRVVIPAEGSDFKIIPVDLDAFYANRSSLIDRLNKVLLN